MYEGESGRSARVRGQEHLRDLEKERPKSVLFKHVKNAHHNEEVKFQMEITQKFRDALSRQANEAVRIFSRPDHELLNANMRKFVKYLRTRIQEFYMSTHILAKNT